VLLIQSQLLLYIDIKIIQIQNLFYRDKGDGNLKTERFRFTPKRFCLVFAVIPCIPFIPVK